VQCGNRINLARQTLVTLFLFCVRCGNRINLALALGIELNILYCIINSRVDVRIEIAAYVLYIPRFAVMG
jgi:hypothetical protein